MQPRFLQLITLFLLMLVTGVFWGTWFTLTRTLSDFSAAEFIHIGQTIIANVAMPMKIIFPGCLLFMLLALWRYPAKRSAGFYAGLTALVLLLITLGITLIILVPIDNEIKTWTTTTIPSGWGNIRNRWDHFHTMRTFTSLASFGCFAIAVIIQKTSLRSSFNSRA